jgi:hypothetical protein
MLLMILPLVRGEVADEQEAAGSGEDVLEGFARTRS